MTGIKAAVLLLALLQGAAFAAPKKTPKAPPPKPQPSVKDLAIQEARKAHANNDGKITGGEVSALRGLWAKNPTGWLYLFDDDGNKALDDREIAAIQFKPKPAPAKPNPKPVAPAKPKQPANKPKA